VASGTLANGADGGSAETATGRGLQLWSDRAKFSNGALRVYLWL